MQEDKEEANANPVLEAVRTTSCDRGWLRLVVQGLFCILVVASFIVIMSNTMKRPKGPPEPKESPESWRPMCYANNCKIICSQGYYDEEFRNSIIGAVHVAEYYCQGLNVMLNKPIFPNSELPVNWLAATRADIIELRIIGGNLQYIPTEAFMSQFYGNTQSVIFEEVHFTKLISDIFVGLQNVKKIKFNDCSIASLEKNVLRPVGDTLQSLVISRCGIWDPENVTGSNELHSVTFVDFSFNNFGHILRKRSFSRLKNCRILILTNSLITSLEAGTFDYLDNIEEIHLSNNLLLSIEPGIFDRARIPKIDLQNNQWHCDCQLDYLLILETNKSLLTDPKCYSPPNMNGKPFSSFKTFCKEKSSHQTFIDTRKDKTLELFYNNICDIPNDGVDVISPFSDYSCNEKKLKKLNKGTMQLIMNNALEGSTNWPFFRMSLANSTMLGIDSALSSDFGLLWYQSNCLSQVYCVGKVPTRLQIYDLNEKDSYVLCPIHKTGNIMQDNCTKFTIKEFKESVVEANILPMTIFVSVTIISIAGLVGALILYFVIRKNPTLLKGSKRVLIVKQKIADAVILPPKTKFQNNNHKILEPLDNSKIVEFKPRNLSPAWYNKNSESSYISAIEPSQGQINEWRLKQYKNESTIQNSQEIVSKEPIKWIYDSEPTYYSLYSTYEHIYEVPSNK